MLETPSPTKTPKKCFIYLELSFLIIVIQITEN